MNSISRRPDPNVGRAFQPDGRARVSFECLTHGFWLLVIAAAQVSAGELAPAKPKLDRAADARYELEGVVREYVDAVTQNWLVKVPDTNPAILEMFRDRDKQPHRDLLPWSGEFAGKYLTGAVQVQRLTGDKALKEYLARFVSKLVQLQAEDGYLGPFPSDNRLEGKGGTWDTWGHYHLMLGLLLWHQDTGDKAALDCALKIGDLLCRKFLMKPVLPKAKGRPTGARPVAADIGESPFAAQQSRNTGRRIVDTGSAEMNHAAIHSLGLLYQVARKPAYLDLARQITREFEDPRAGDYLRVALAGKEFYQGPKPRWESLHPIQGIAQLYWITGEEDYRRAYERLWWSIVKLDRHNNGGFSSGEQAQGNPYHRGAIETCCTVAWIAMSVDMLRLTGNSVVADELELSTLNQVLGYQHRSGKHCTYNTPMDGVRRNSTQEIAFQVRPGSEEVNCCSANAPRGFGMISDWALMTDGQGLVLNWFGPCRMTARVQGTSLVLRQQTDYPREGRILLEVSPERDVSFPLKIRIPYWSADSRVQLNGKAVGEVRRGSYLTLDRAWKRGDSVEIQFDLSPHYWVGERECAGKTSIYHGPLLLVCQSAPRPLSFSPQWKHFGEMAAVNETGATVESSFEGTTVVWTGQRFDDAGRAQVTIDGKQIAVVDQYAPGRNLPFSWEHKGLAPGRHTIRLTLLDGNNPASKGRWINVISLGPPGSAGPVLDASKLSGSLAPVDGAKPSPLLLMSFTATDGSKVRLRDYGTAGDAGTPYASWLNVQNVRPTLFSEGNPLRSGRPPWDR